MKRELGDDEGFDDSRGLFERRDPRRTLYKDYNHGHTIRKRPLGEISADHPQSPLKRSMTGRFAGAVAK
jgi:hypothetical protein